MEKCRMVLVVAVDTKEAESKNAMPLAAIIVVAPSKKRAEEYAKKELEGYIRSLLSQHNSITVKPPKDLGPILCPPIPTTIFLYTQHAGRIK